MQPNSVEVSNHIMPNYEWTLNSPSTATTESMSPSREKLLIERVDNLELIVGNLLTRIIELEKNNYTSEIINRDWSSATKKELLLKKQIESNKFSLVKYFASRSPSNSV
jgi:hypothetical protein